MASKEPPNPAIATLAVLDLVSGQIIPIPLDNEDVNTITWLVKRLENFSAIVQTKHNDKPTRVKVSQLFVGDVELKPGKWEEKTIEYYLLFGDPWFAKIIVLPTPSVAQLIGKEDTAASCTIAETVETLKDCVVSTSHRGSLSGLGNGVEFVNMSATSPTRIDWSKNAPRWRVAHPGLSIEGKCNNRKCAAHNKMVVVNFGFDDISLVDDHYKVKCPLCQKHVTPATCAFNNCQWKWNGIRFIESATPKPPKICVSDWKTADDAYHVFRPTQSDAKVRWKQLTVCTKALNENIKKCLVCSFEQRLSGGLQELDCGHNYHEPCLKSILTSMQALIHEAQNSISHHDSRNCPHCQHKEIHQKFVGNKYIVSDSAIFEELQ